MSEFEVYRVEFKNGSISKLPVSRFQYYDTINGSEQSLMEPVRRSDFQMDHLAWAIAKRHYGSSVMNVRPIGQMSEGEK